MVEVLVGVLCLILGGYQVNSVYKSFSFVKHHGNKETSPFYPLALWSGMVFAVALIGMGISFVFKLV